MPRYRSLTAQLFRAGPAPSKLQDGTARHLHGLASAREAAGRQHREGQAAHQGRRWAAALEMTDDFLRMLAYYDPLEADQVYVALNPDGDTARRLCPSC
jgi:hypothetical protein